jgi:hypothetical protein
MDGPHRPHWKAVLWIVGYLKAHLERCLLYRANNDLCVDAFTD